MKTSQQLEQPTSSPKMKTTAASWWTSLTKEKQSGVLIGIATVICMVLDNPFYSAMYGCAIAITGYLMVQKKGGTWIRKQKWISYILCPLASAMIATPAVAQGVTDNTSACTNGGLMSGLTNFVDGLFSSITFGGVGGGTLSNLICQLIGYIIVALVLGFISIIGAVAFQVGFQQQPVSVVANPIFAFLIFAGGASVVITVFLGTGVS